MTEAFKPSYGDAGVYTPDNLINGDFHQVRATVELASTQKLKRGSVLSKNESGKYVLVPKGKEKESECILAEGSSQKNQVVYLTGEFNENEVTIGSGANLQAVREALRKCSIFLSRSQKSTY